MRRWAAEEFRGELDDQVNPFWQRKAATTLEPASLPSVVMTIDANQSPNMAAAKAKMLRLFDGDSTVSVENTVPGDEDWEL